MELKGDGINVMTVCPGYVRTDFGANMVAKRRGNIRPKSVHGITADRVARAVYRGYRKGKREVIVPWTMIPGMKLYQLFPGLVEWGMAKAMRNARHRSRVKKSKSCKPSGLLRIECIGRTAVFHPLKGRLHGGSGGGGCR